MWGCGTHIHPSPRVLYWSQYYGCLDMPGGTHLDPRSHLKDISPFQSKVTLQDPYDSYYDCKMPFRDKHLGSFEEKQSLLLISPGIYKACQGAHSEGSRRKRDWNCLGLGFCFYWGCVSWGTLYWWMLNTRVGIWSFEAWREKRGPNSQLSKSTKISKTKEPQLGKAA